MNYLREHIPGRFPRRCLVMTTGRTPQVVTETVYALATRPGQEVFIPSEIHLVTTEEGRRQAELDLLDSGAGRLTALCAELGIDRGAIRFDRSSIRVAIDAAGAPLEDIRSVQDNQASADAIVACVRELTSDAQAAVHVSLAGGRKTMGFYLGYALSLFGRPQDRLSHVLVDPRFENLPDFFFPTKASSILRLRDGKGTVDAMHARVELADIPVVSLRGLLGADLLGDARASYAEIVRRARSHFEHEAKVDLDLNALRLEAGGKPVRMGTAEAIWYGFFIDRAAAGKPGVAWRNSDSRLPARELREFVGRLNLIDRGVDEDVCDTWIRRDGTIDADAADRLRTRVNEQLKRALGPGPAVPYLIAREGRRSRSCYRVNLTMESIKLTKS
ncbi:MAG: TIGR02584 family CRISPR-associated protein [Gammaproteobacteria bacterium]|nr:TIGR02584 family CRISPR-associated protein [Gammaproteobacteria bacterium]